MKKLLARGLLPFVFIGLCVMPAYALLPGAIAPIVYGGGTSAGAAVGSSIGGWGLLVGSIFAFVGVSDSTGYTERLPTTTDPDLAVPAPDAPSVATVIPGSSGPVYVQVGTDYSEYASNPSVPCNKAPWDQNFSCGSNTQTVSQCMTGYVIPNQNQSPDWSFACLTTVVVPDSCPSGYVLSGSQCTLADARVAQPDDKCDFERAGSALAVLSDPDCGGGARLVVVNETAGTYSITGVSAETGNPMSIIITPQPDGGSLVQVSEQIVIGNSTATQTATATVAGDGTITSVSGSTQTGTLPTDGTAPTGTQVQPVSINFPTDYARTGEAQTAANTLAPKLDTLHDDLSLTQTVNDPTQLTEADMPGFGTTFDALKAWTLPGHASTCPAPSVDLSGVGLGVYAFDAHCQLVTNHYAALQAAMIVVWSLLGLFVVLRA